MIYSLALIDLSSILEHTFFLIFHCRKMNDFVASTVYKLYIQTKQITVKFREVSDLLVEWQLAIVDNIPLSI